ncbi:MAG: hypothetical protein R3Y23_05595 [Bacillota bacterium]
MKGLSTLIAMQLKDKLDFSFAKSFKVTAYKLLFAVIKYAVITIAIYYAFNVLSMLRLVSLLSGIPQSAMNVLFTAMVGLSTIVATVAVMNSMYFTKDNALLLTLPVSQTTVFTSKLIVFYIYELIRNSSYILPVLIAYGMVNAFPIIYYVWLAPAFMLLTAIPVAIGALLSVPLMMITTIIKQYKVVQGIITAAGIGIAVFVIVKMINAIPSDIDLVGTWGTTFWSIQTWLTNFSYNFSVFTYLLIGIAGERNGIVVTLFGSTQLIVIGCVVVGLIVVLAITYLLVRPLFLHMASSPFEYKKSKIKRVYYNKKKNPAFSAMYKNIVLTLRSSEKIGGILAIAIGMPLVILLLNSIYDAISVRLAGVYMAMAFNMLIIMLLAMSTNIDMAHVFSEEGHSAYINKTIPRSYLIILSSKLLVNAVAMSIAIAISTWIYSTFVHYDTSDIVLIFFTLEFAYISHLMMSVSSDIMNPQNQQYATTGGHVSNPNDLRSGVKGYIVAIAVTFGAYFLIQENSHSVWFKMCAITACLMIYQIYMYISKAKIFYKEL